MSSPLAGTVEAYLEAAQRLANARLEYSREYQLAFYKSGNSFHATQVAIEKTKDEITLAQAALKVAEVRMERE